MAFFLSSIYRRGNVQLYLDMLPIDIIRYVTTLVRFPGWSLA
jgi:hypothetical protein